MFLKKRIGFIFNYTENNNITTVIFMFVSRNPVNRLKLIKLKEVHVCCQHSFSFLQYLLNGKKKMEKKKQHPKAITEQENVNSHNSEYTVRALV